MNKNLIILCKVYESYNLAKDKLDKIQHQSLNRSELDQLFKYMHFEDRCFSCDEVIYHRLNFNVKMLNDRSRLCDFFFPNYFSLHLYEVYVNQCLECGRKNELLRIKRCSKLAGMTPLHVVVKRIITSPYPTDESGRPTHMEPLKEMIQQLSITTTTKCYESRLEHLNNHILCMRTLLDKINPSNDENEVNNVELEEHTYKFLDLLLEKYLINAKIKMIQEINIQDVNKKDMQNVYTYIKSNDLLQNKIKTIFSDKDNKMFQVKNVEKLEDLNYGNTQGTERVIIDKNLLNSTYFNNFKYDLLINVFSTNDNNLEKEITKKLKEIENQRKGNETKGGSRKKKINKLRTKKQIYKSAKNTRRRRCRR